MALADAVAALDRGDNEAAITVLVELWRERRCEQLANLIDRVDERLTTRPFAGLADRKAATTISRLREVANANDPRLGTLLAKWLDRPPFAGASSKPLWELVLQIASTLGDKRLHPLFADYLAALRRSLSPASMRDALVSIERCWQIRDAIANTVTRPFTDDELAPLVARLACTKRKSEAELLDEIYADPTADAPRLVYADLLQENGDPRGEFIALQLKPTRTDEETARMQKLFEKHRKSWLGGLAVCVAHTRSTFERGFLSTAVIMESAHKKLLLTWEDKSWATVEAIEGSLAKEVIRYAPLHALRTANLRDGDELECLTEGWSKSFQKCALPYVTHVSIAFDGRGVELRLSEDRALSRVPNLRELSMPASFLPLASLRSLLEAPAVRRLERLVLRGARSIPELVGTPAAGPAIVFDDRTFARNGAGLYE